MINIVNAKTMLGCAAIVLVVYIAMPSSPTEKSVANLIDQFRGDATYWNPYGQDVSCFDSSRRHAVQTKVAVIVDRTVQWATLVPMHAGSDKGCPGRP